MHYHSQNLNDTGPKILHGRAWLRPDRQREIHWEWYLGKHSTSFHIGIGFGHGDSDNGVLLYFCIPYIISLYFGIAGIYRCKECELGVAIHNDAIWFKTLSLSNEWSRDLPWWRKGFSWHFPWSYDWYKTEVLTHTAPHLAEPVFTETRQSRLERKIDSFEMMRLQDAAAKGVEIWYPYKYTLKNGKVQEVTAKVHVERRTWRMKWWPLLPFQKVSTTISVNFSEEVGEGTGSWKGGTIGCGYDMLPNESPLECLRRMEKERTFGR